MLDQGVWKSIALEHQSFRSHYGWVTRREGVATLLLPVGIPQHFAAAGSSLTQEIAFLAIRLRLY